MAYKINLDCTSCGDCMPACPKGAISQNWGIFQIDPKRCDSCGKCTEVCPVKAPQPEPDEE